MKYQTETLLAYLIDYKRSHDGVAPTLHEIRAAMNIPALATVVKMLKILEADGQVKLRRGSRTIELTGGKWEYSPTQP